KRDWSSDVCSSDLHHKEECIRLFFFLQVPSHREDVLVKLFHTVQPSLHMHESHWSLKDLHLLVRQSSNKYSVFLQYKQRLVHDYQTMLSSHMMHHFLQTPPPYSSPLLF